MSMTNFRRQWGWWLAGGAVLAILLVLLARVYFREEREPLPVVRPEVEAPPVEDTSPKHPLPAPAPKPEAENEPPAPLPPLENSDASFAGALADLVEAEALRRNLTPENIIPRIVVTIDNLPRDQVALRLRAVTPVPGLFRPSGDDDEFELREEHFGRYEPLVKLADSVDTDRLVAVYRRYYPLFQQAYADLGYPSAYFNDRLVEVIDHLLEAPEVDPPIRLTRPHVLYEFADPDLERLSAGQKVLVRIGPKNAAVLKDKLREIRDAIVETVEPVEPASQD